MAGINWGTPLGFAYNPLGTWASLIGDIASPGTDVLPGVDNPFNNGTKDNSSAYGGSLNSVGPSNFGGSTLGASTSGGGGGGGVARPVVDPNEIAYWDDTIGSLNRLLQSSETQKAQGLEQLGNSYNQQLSRSNEAESKALRDYGIKREDTTRDKQSNLGAIDTRARTTNDSLRRLLGLAGAGISSAADFAAPNAVARQAGQQRSQTLDQFGRNARNIDLAEGDAKTGFANQRQDLESQKREKEQNFLRGILESQNSIFDNLSNAATQKGLAQGGNYTSTAGARMPFQNAISERRSALDNLFNQYRDPQFAVKNVEVKTPELGQYTNDRIALQAGQQNPGIDQSLLPYLPNLKDKREQSFI